MIDHRTEQLLLALPGRVTDIEESQRKTNVYVATLERLAKLYTNSLVGVAVNSNTETLDATKILSDRDGVIQYLDPGGASRTVTLPIASSLNHYYVIVNTADAAEELNVEDVDTNSIVDIAQNQEAVVVSNGTTWRLVGLVDGDYILVDGTRAFTGEQSMGTNKLTNVVNPTADQDAATKKYVDDNAGGATLKFCSRYGPSSLLDIDTSWTTVPFDTADREDTDYFTHSSGEITLKVAGDYKISFHVTGEEHAIPDDTRWHIYAKLQQKAAAGSFADIAGTEVIGYCTTANMENSVCSVPVIYTAVINDVIKVMAKGNQADVKVQNNLSRILVEFIE